MGTPGVGRRPGRLGTPGVRGPSDVGRAAIIAVIAVRTSGAVIAIVAIIAIDTTGTFRRAAQLDDGQAQSLSRAHARKAHRRDGVSTLGADQSELGVGSRRARAQVDAGLATRGVDAQCLLELKGARRSFGEVDVEARLDAGLLQSSPVLGVDLVGDDE